MNVKTGLIWWLLLLALFGSVLANAAEYTGKVVAIADGDTLTLLVDRQQMKVRLAEIDTPERRQPYGSRAKEGLSQLAFGRRARVVAVDRDRYGRTVGRVYVGDTDVNAELVRRGAAWVYASNFTIGEAGGSYFDGRLDEVQLYTDLVSASEIPDMFKKGTVTTNMEGSAIIHAPF
jgi:endonuclease YncB( thermonuclease family)